jgi:hypothetical protein
LDPGRDTRDVQSPSADRRASPHVEPGLGIFRRPDGIRHVEDRFKFAPCNDPFSAHSAVVTASVRRACVDAATRAAKVDAFSP